MSDSLDQLGLGEQIVLANISPVRPGLRAIGRAATLQFAPSEAVSADPYDEMIDFMDALQPGELVVVATGSSMRSAYWGELFSCCAIGHGVAGVVTDGPLRDRRKIIELGFAALGLGVSCGDYQSRHRIVAQRAAVRLGGVVVNEGDLVVADDDGVVVVPAGRADEACEAAQRKAEVESTVKDELLAGASLRAVWERHRVL